MDERFKKQIAIVTGAADGLGRGVAERIASEGGKVILLDINITLLNRTVEELRTIGLDVEGIQVDISKEESVVAILQEIELKYHKIDVLVNSAGIVGPTSTKITEYSTEEYDKIYNVNLKGAFLITKYTLKIMEKNNYGRVLLIASIAGKEGNPFMVGYSSMKAGIIGMIKGVAKEYATSGITINGLAPAVIKTSMNKDTSAEQLAYMIEKIPMKRLGTIEEVAAMSCWIVSKESSFTTGFVFDISGGRATY